MRVAASHDIRVEMGSAGQVSGHDGGAAAVEREGRLQHPAEPDADEVLQPGAVLVLEDGDRIALVGPDDPVCRVLAPGQDRPGL